jgi:hypothetical protein
MPAATSNDNYEEFLRGIQLRLLSLRECSANVDRNAYWHVVEDQHPTAPQLSAQYVVGTVEKQSFTLVAELGLLVQKPRAPRSAKSNGALSVRATYDTRFDCKKRVTAEHVERFAREDVRLLIWPYFRELVSNLTARMWVPPILIPLASGDERREAVQAVADE